MKIELEEWGEWSSAMRSVAQYGSVDGRGFGIAYSGKALSEFFGVSNEPHVLQNTFMRNQEFMNEISRHVIESGRLHEDRLIYLTKEDLLPYFERRAATATAPA